MDIFYISNELGVDPVVVRDYLLENNRIDTQNKDELYILKFRDIINGYTKMDNIIRTNSK